MLKQFMLGLGLTALLVYPTWAQEASGIDVKGMDLSVKPCQDFYRYANGGWMASHPIPADKPRWGTFNALAERNKELLNQILEQLAAHSQAPGSNDQKLADFYATGLSDSAREGQALSRELQRIDAISNREQLLAEIIRLHKLGLNVFFGFGSIQDSRDSSQVIGMLAQGGLGLPEREYYFREDEKSKQHRQLYRQHIEKMLKLVGRSDAASEADQVLKLETRLAGASLTNVQMRDPEATYNPTPISTLAQAEPLMGWPDYFQAIGAPAMQSVNVDSPGFFKALNQVVAEVPLEELKSYLRWQVTHRLANYLSEPFVEENFQFYGKTLTGAQVNQPRWRQVVDVIDSLMGDALGQKYVAKYFPPSSRQRVETMVENLRSALGEDIQTLPWMGPETRTNALAKLKSFRAKIGYPDHWRDYSKLTIGRTSFLDNVLAARAFEVQRDLDKIGKPVDRNEWYMSPPTVNAYYDPQTNEIVFPAGILQPPFFQAEADDAVNYGALGMVIGHEMSHGFDDSGRQYDAQGNLKNWWTQTDLANFQKRAQAVEKQYSSYQVADGLHINGKLVLGESIADIGGLKLALMAYQRSLDGKPGPTLDGFTPMQRFFLGYARVWAMNMRPEYERLQVNTDPHPHPRYRVIGPISNMVEFQEAFHCGAGEPMVRGEKDKVQIW